MLSTNKGNLTVKAVLRVDMVMDGKRMEKGDVVEMSGHNFKYLVQHDRVAEATTENIAAVRAQLSAAKKGK